MPSWNVNDQRVPQGRLALFSYLSAAFVVLLLIGFWKLQVVQSGHFSDLADRNGIRSIAIIAPRGAMLDREGRVLVDSYPSFSILLLRDNPKLLERSLPQIEDGLGIAHEDLQQQLDAARGEPKFLPVIIKPAASEADIAFVESHRADLPVLDLIMVQRRRYPHEQMLANTIGYVGEVSPSDMEKNPDRYRPGDIVGKAGLEKEYNDQIVGTDGMRRVVVNSVGKVMRTLDNVEAIPGKPIQLTIDEDLQQIAETDMADKEGAVVAMDGRTGEILAMVSRPTFDPNDFAVRIPAKEWATLNTDSQTPLLNRAIQAQLAPAFQTAAIPSSIPTPSIKLCTCFSPPMFPCTRFSSATRCPSADLFCSMECQSSINTRSAPAATNFPPPSSRSLSACIPTSPNKHEISIRSRSFPTTSIVPRTTTRSKFA